MRFSIAAAISIVLGLFCSAVVQVLADIGTATSYGPPYTPTKCYGNSQDQFPAGNMFVSVTEAFWDNGAACGRRYRMKCLSGPNKPCKGGTIDVGVVNVCSTKPCPSTFVMSREAFSAISDSPRAKINIEYIQI